MSTRRPPDIDWPTARRLGALYGCDPRTIFKEANDPASVKGEAGRRVRSALAELRASAATETAT